MGVVGGRPQVGGARIVVRGVWGQALSPPCAACPQGRQPGSAAHLLWAWVCGRGDPALALSRARPVGCRVPKGWREVSPGGGGLTVVRGVRCQALGLSGMLVLGVGSRAPLPMPAGRGWCGCGDPAVAPQRALLRAAVARCGSGWKASPVGCLAPL